MFMSKKEQNQQSPLFYLTMINYPKVHYPIASRLFENSMFSGQRFSLIELPGGQAMVGGGCNRKQAGCNTKMATSQPKMVRFSFCKKDFEAKNVLYHMGIYGFYWKGGSIRENTEIPYRNEIRKVSRGSDKCEFLIVTDLDLLPSTPSGWQTTIPAGRATLDAMTVCASLLTWQAVTCCRPQSLQNTVLPNTSILKYGPTPGTVVHRLHTGAGKNYLQLISCFPLLTTIETVNLRLVIPHDPSGLLKAMDDGGSKN